MAGVKAQKKAENKEAKAAKAAAQAERDRPMIDALRLLWNRMGEACKRAGVDYNEVCGKAGIYATLPPKDATVLLDGGGKLTTDTRLPFGYVVGRDGISSLVKLADLLGCSLDYLFGRDVPESGTGTAEPKWQTGEPPEEGEYLVRYRAADDDETAPDFTGICIYYDGAWALSTDAVVTAWYRVPRKQ